MKFGTTFTRVRRVARSIGCCRVAVKGCVGCGVARHIASGVFCGGVGASLIRYIGRVGWRIISQTAVGWLGVWSVSIRQRSTPRAIGCAVRGHIGPRRRNQPL